MARSVSGTTRQQRKRRFAPRSRPERDRCPVTPGHWWMYGYPATGESLYPRKVMVTYHHGGGLTGDADIIATAYELARHRQVSLRNPLAVLALLLGLFCVGVEVGGDVPVSGRETANAAGADI